MKPADDLQEDQRDDQDDYDYRRPPQEYIPLPHPLETDYPLSE